MRVAFSILFNSLHHMRHYNWDVGMIAWFDYWAVAQGAAGNGGSTAWCNPVQSDLMDANGNSVDGTFERLRSLKTVCSEVLQWPCDAHGGAWKSKDDMVNAALDNLRIAVGAFDKPVFLWEVDADESWSDRQYTLAEKELLDSGGDCGCFHANHYVGKNLVARGTWGEGNAPSDPLKNAYRRLWLWKGQRFASHEPPKLEGGNGKEVLLSPRFDHYAYFYEKDVAFKEKYYSGHNGLLSRWRALQEREAKDFPRPLSDLIDGPWGKTQTEIVRI